MKKRIFIPVSFGFIILEMFFLAIAIGGICSLIIIDILKLYPEINNSFIKSFLLLCGILFVLYTFFRMLLACKITLKEIEIYKCGDGLPKFEKIQYKCSIIYADIKNISIIASSNDSKNKKIQLKWVSSSVTKKYFEIELINGKKQRIWINYFTKNQIIKILNLINENMKLCGNENILNIDTIMQDWFKFDKSRKKKQIEQ